MEPINIRIARIISSIIAGIKQPECSPYPFARGHQPTKTNPGKAFSIVAIIIGCSANHANNDPQITNTPFHFLHIKAFL